MSQAVMICDPSAVVREMLAHCLKPMGFECLMSNNPVDAFQKIQQQQDRICLIYSEFLLPGSSGLELLNQVKTLPNQIPFVFVSTESDKENVIKSLKAGAKDYIVKPFSIEQIQEKTKRFIDL